MGTFPVPISTVDWELVLLFARLLAVALTCQRFLHPLLFARLEVEAVTLHFLDDVLLLDFTLESAQCILEGFPLLHSYFGQRLTPPNSSCRIRQRKELQRNWAESSLFCEKPL
jgi:hypothetical protein